MSLHELIDIAGERLVVDAPFGSRTTYRVGGTARAILTVTRRDEFTLFGSALSGIDEIYVLGNGSNTLVSDRGFDGLVLVLTGEFDEMRVGPDATVLVGAGLDLPVIARRSVEAGLRGFEWAVGVPGTLGGAVAMNAGGHGSDMAASVTSMEVWDLDAMRCETWSRDTARFGYRTSAIGPRHVVLSATLQLHDGSPDEGREMMREIVRWRREHQPGGANAGSVFQNPSDTSAGALIDACGLKGRRYGSAAVSEKHANFIQVDADGRADDVATLMNVVHDEVLAATGVDLHTEIRRVGFGDE